MNVSLTPELEKFVENEVQSGLYQTASEVVRAGLRRLKDDRPAHMPTVPKSLKELEAQLLQSIDQIDHGEATDVDEMMRRLRRRIKAARG